MPQAHDKRTPLPQQQYIAPSQSNGAKGQQKRGGPRPARHIPWPEIFKHHISLVEGHMKMIDMVRKHTVEGTNNHRTICELIDRSKDMLWQAKKTARSFVPPPNQLEQVPLGSSSDTMYPGYSPGHFEYGKAAEEFGRYASEAKRQGKDIKLDGVDYEVGQSKGLGHLTLAQIRAAKGEKSTTGSGSDSGAGPSGLSAATKKGKIPDGGDENHGAGEQMFFMDSNPTPVNLPGAANSSAKRRALPEPVEANTSKKQKKNHDGRATQSNNPAEDPAEPVRVEFEDISGEVDARLKEKEEKRKRKKEKEAKKRKRESERLSIITAEAPPATDSPKPKNKKMKKSDESNEASASPLKKRSATDDEQGAEGSSAAVAAEKPKKKTRVAQETISEEKTEKHQLGEVEVSEEHPKKKKKSKSSEDMTKEDKKKKRTADGEATVEIAEAEGKAKKKQKTEA